jgi:hypothetical protein
LTFPVTTLPVAASRRVTLTAAWGSVAVPIDVGITPPQLASLALTPTALKGGTPGSGTVTITGPAPATGTLVTLAGDKESLASLPPSVTVPAGATTASFPLSTRPVTTPSVFTLTAALGSQVRYGTLVLTGALVSSLALEPGRVTGGAPAQGTVKLAQPAPADGVVITLTSTNAAAAVPASVMVPAGATTATFAITTQTVSSGTTVLITASYAGVSWETATLTVLPAGIASLGLDPSSTTGGGTVKAMLTLRGPAPPGGAIVALSTDSPSLLLLPSTVTVPPGATTTTFDLATQPVSAATVATMAAVYAGETQTAALTLLPVVVTGLSLPPTALPGGETATATLTLSAPAPPGGAVVVLAGSDPWVVSLPPSVTVPEGAARITFPVTTSPVSALTRVTITATYGGVTRSATLVVSSLKLAWLRLGLESVLGGTSVIGAVMLSEPAPPGGVTVRLSSDRPEVARGPETVRVEEGTLVAFLLVTTASVDSLTPVTVAARAGGVTQEVVLQLLPAER